MATNMHDAGASLINYWDIFRKDVAKQKTLIQQTNVSDTLFKIIKCIAYILLFLVIFGGAIVSRASLHVLTHQLYVERSSNHTTNHAESVISYHLLFAISIPDGIQLVISFLRLIFGKREAPSLLQLVVVIVKECLHFFCLSTIVFKLMPILNAVEVCAYLSGIPLVPSILNSVSYRKNTPSRDRAVYKHILNVVSILIQGAAVCAVPIYKLINDEIDNMETFLMIFSAICVSVRWFETYFRYSKDSSNSQDSYSMHSCYSRDSSNAKYSNVFYKLFDYDNRRPMTHTVSSLVTSLCRIALAIVIFPIFLSPGVINPKDAFSETPSMSTNSTAAQPITAIVISTNVTANKHNNITNYAYDWLLTPFLVHFITSIVLFYVATIAVRLRMDKICFCIALSFGTPVYVGAIIGARMVDGTNWISEHWQLKGDITDRGVYTMFACFFVSWISQLWTCRHIWFSSHDRMAPLNRRFVLPHYCSPLADVSLLHSRRQKSKHNDKNNGHGCCQTKVYICATMWHEKRKEMKQILETLFKLDLDQTARSMAKAEQLKPSFESLYTGLNKEDINRDYYEFEAHVMFDDAMDTKDNKRQPNIHVQRLMDVISEAGESVHQSPPNLPPPEKIATPYGGRLEWTLPGDNKLIVHLKDKDKIRHKKRWSQIMYLYYLIGYKLVKEGIQTKETQINDDIGNVQSIFGYLPPDLVKQDAIMRARELSIGKLRTLKEQRSENEMILKMWRIFKRTFLIIWSPGCFSLFRAKALMDDNVMRTYASLPTEPKHYLQYDQGEDRWLCTLMLQQGYRIEYCAAAEAITFAPEEFREFFNQRRRWMPSTMANILDLLLSYRRTTKQNSNISNLYIFYQIIVFASSVLGPSTVLLAMQSAIRTVFGTSAIVAYILTYGPTVIFIFICLKFKTQTQLTVAMILSTIYAMLMMAVVVGTIVSISEEGFFTPSAVFMYVLVGVFFVAGLFHPHELTDLFWGLLYFICIPAGYLFLIIYSICNLNNVSWGTRETQTADREHRELESVSDEVMEDLLDEVQSTPINNTSCAGLIRWINNLIILRSLESVANIFKRKKTETGGIVDQNDSHSTSGDVGNDDKSWNTEDGRIKKLEPDDEVNFWNELISNYLKPLKLTKNEEKAIVENLKDFRNKVAFAFFFVNGLWLVIMTAMHEVKSFLNINIPTVGGSTIAIEPLGLLFLTIFAILLFLQFCGMMKHRYGTFLHLLASTNLNSKELDPKSVIDKFKSLSSPGAKSEFMAKEIFSDSTKGNDSQRSEQFEMVQSISNKEMGKSIKGPKNQDNKKRLHLQESFRENFRKLKLDNNEKMPARVCNLEENL